MAEPKISTSALLNRLFRTSSISRFVDYLDKQQAAVSFSGFLADLCAGKNTLASHVIKKSGIERTYGHQIFSGRRKPSRDKVIQLAFGFEMDYAETQELLKAARKNPLYPKLKRDAVIIYALKKKKSIEDVQATLLDLDLPPLGKEDRYG